MVSNLWVGSEGFVSNAYLGLNSAVDVGGVVDWSVNRRSLLHKKRAIVNRLTLSPEEESVSSYRNRRVW